MEATNHLNALTSTERVQLLASKTSTMRRSVGRISAPAPSLPVAVVELGVVTEAAAPRLRDTPEFTKSSCAP